MWATASLRFRQGEGQRVSMPWSLDTLNPMVKDLRCGRSAMQAAPDRRVTSAHPLEREDPGQHAVMMIFHQVMLFFGLKRSFLHASEPFKGVLPHYPPSQQAAPRRHSPIGSMAVLVRTGDWRGDTHEHSAFPATTLHPAIVPCRYVSVCRSDGAGVWQRGFTAGGRSSREMHQSWRA